MGLTSWSGRHVIKADVTTAKNYLTQDEIVALNQVVSGMLDTAETRARQRQAMTMSDWVLFVDSFIVLTGGQVLQGSGRVSHGEMKAVTETRYANFDAARRARTLAQADADHFAEIEHLRETGEGLGRQ